MGAGGASASGLEMGRLAGVDRLRPERAVPAGFGPPPCLAPRFCGNPVKLDGRAGGAGQILSLPAWRDWKAPTALAMHTHVHCPLADLASPNNVW